MREQITEPVPQLLYYQLADEVVAFSTTRHGGVSTGNYASMNINNYCGDSPSSIAENSSLLCQTLQISSSRLVYPHQIHKTECLIIDHAFLAMTDDERRRRLEGYDAIVTSEYGVCIGVSTADCIPIIIYDPVRHVVAAVHAGWRGTVARIAEKTTAEMQKTYGSDSETFKAVIGPGISMKNFEVGWEVWQEFANQGFPMGDISDSLECNENGSRPHIDLPYCNELQLLEMGIRKENITQAGICTYESSDNFFSARKLGIKSGRIFTGVMLRNKS